MNLSPLPIQKFFDNAGRPLNGGLLFTYVSGTTTKLATYQDQAGTPNTNPIVLNFRGEANVWLDQTLTYKFVLAPEGDTDPPTRPTWSVDNISAGITFASLTQQIIGQILFPRTQIEINAGKVPVSYGYPPGNVFRFMTSAQIADVQSFTYTLDVTAAIQATIDSVGTLGGAIDFPEGGYSVRSTINISTAIWTPYVFRGVCNTRINSSTFAGIVFNDASGNIRFENMEFKGPGKAAFPAVAISSGLSQGWVKGCRIESYYYGIDCSGTSNACIERNHITDCHAAVNCVKVFPLFSNIISIVRNWLDFCDYGVFIDQAFAVDVFSNTFEANGVGLFFSGVREFTIRGANWLEAHTTNSMQITAASTGLIERGTHIAPGGANVYTIDATCRVLDLHTTQMCVVRNSAVQAIPNNLATNILWDTEIVDPSGMHSTSVLTQNINIAIAGVYRIEAQTEFALLAAPAVGTVGQLQVQKSGVLQREVISPMSANIATGLSLSFLVECASGDTLTALAYQNSGAPVNVAGGLLSGFSAQLLTID